MEHRLFNTGDQIWLVDGRTVKLITHDGMTWEAGQDKLSRVSRLYEMHSDGGQTWYGQRDGKWHVIQVVSTDGKVWSEENPVVTNLVGAEKVIHQVTTFCCKLILKVLQ